MNKVASKFAVFDIDGTLFRWQLFHELVFELNAHGLFPPDVSKRLEQAFLHWRGLQASWNDYEQEVVAAITTNITEITPKQLEAAAELVVARSGHKVYAYTANLAKKLKSEGYLLVAISGSQQEIAEIFAKKHGFDYCIGMVHERTDAGIFSGDFERFVIDKKGQLLQEFVAEKQLSFSDSYAIGDSASDAAMLEIVEHPIAFNPNSELYRTATEHDWPVVIERKNIAYRLERTQSGYAVAETVIF